LTRLPLEGGAPPADTSINLYGSVGLAYDRKPFHWTLSYTRRANNASGTGTTTNLDVASATARWDLARRWRLIARATWQRQSSASELPRSIVVLAGSGATVLLDANGVPVTDPDLAVYEVRDVAENSAIRVEMSDSGADVDSYNVVLRASHTLTRRLQLQAAATYWYQTTESDLTEEAQRDSLRFELGFTWSFDPISL
jgi:hypothetical protein